MTILRQGFPSENVFLILAGIVKLERCFANGRSSIVGLRFGGDLLGAGSALLQKDQPVTAVAVTPSSLCRLSAETFISLLGTDSRLSLRVHLAQCRELHTGLEQTAGLACLSARERLEQFLHLLTLELTPGPNSRMIELPLKDCELAQVLGITPQYLCRLMHELASAGHLVRRGARWVFTVPLWNEHAALRSSTS